MSYRQYQQQLLPPPLRGDVGEVFAGDLGAAKDDVVTLAKDAVYIGQLVDPDALGREVPADGLAKLGADADLEQGPIESPQDYRARILGAWDLWGWAGTPYGYSLAFERLKRPVRGARFISASQWVAPDGLTSLWSRFWPIVWTGLLAAGRFTVGPWAIVGGNASGWEILRVGDFDVGDGSTVGSTATVEELADLRRALAKWKNARDRVPALVLADGAVIGVPGLLVGGFDVGALIDGTPGESSAIHLTFPLNVGAFVVGARGYADDPDGPWFPIVGRDAFV